MFGIIIVFPNKDNAVQIQNMLMHQGLPVKEVCTTGAQALKAAETLDEGIVICGYKYNDMVYTELREYLSEAMEMVLIASADRWSSGHASGVLGLSMPFRAYDLVNTVNMLTVSMQKKRKKKRFVKKERDPKEQALIDQAKNLLMSRNNMTEEQAHKYLQKTSMDNQTTLIETAQMVLSIMSE